MMGNARRARRLPLAEHFSRYVQSRMNEWGLLKHGELTIWVGDCAAVGWDSEFDIWRVLFECLLVGGNNTVRTLNLKTH
jgi:hypothetical protein